MSQTKGRKTYTKKLSKKIEIKFIQSPMRIISGMRKYPDPKTTALGGVATGSMKAHDAATVAETIKMKGCTLIARAIGAKMGRSIEVVARLEVISVRKFTDATRTSTKTRRGTASSNVI